MRGMMGGGGVIKCGRCWSVHTRGWQEIHGTNVDLVTTVHRNTFLNQFSPIVRIVHSTFLLEGPMLSSGAASVLKLWIFPFTTNIRGHSTTSGIDEGHYGHVWPIVARFAYRVSAFFLRDYTYWIVLKTSACLVTIPLLYNQACPSDLGPQLWSPDR